MDLYFDRHDGQAVTIEDFVKSFEDVSGRDLTQFSLWYRRRAHRSSPPQAPMTPPPRASRSRSSRWFLRRPARPTRSRCTFRSSIALFAEDGTPLEPSSVDGAEYGDNVLHLTERSRKPPSRASARGRSSLSTAASRPRSTCISISRPRIWRCLPFETDHFARWQALTDLALPTLLAAARDARDGKPVVASKDFVEGAACGSDGRSRNRPRPGAGASEQIDIARELGGNNDPDAIHAGRSAVLQQVADATRASSRHSTTA